MLEVGNGVVSELRSSRSLRGVPSRILVAALTVDVYSAEWSDDNFNLLRFYTLKDSSFPIGDAVNGCNDAYGNTGGFDYCRFVWPIPMLTKRSGELHADFKAQDVHNSISCS
jgi:hypothetical protein